MTEEKLNPGSACRGDAGKGKTGQQAVNKFFKWTMGPEKEKSEGGTI